MRYIILPADTVENFIDLENFEGTIPEGSLLENGSDNYKVGDTVACRKGHNLEQGWDGLSRPREEQVNKLYPYGVCVSVDPFVIISQDGEGIWQKKNPRHYYAIAKWRHIDKTMALKAWIRKRRNI